MTITGDLAFEPDHTFFLVFAMPPTAGSIVAGQGLSDPEDITAAWHPSPVPTLARLLARSSSCAATRYQVGQRGP